MTAAARATGRWLTTWAPPSPVPTGPPAAPVLLCLPPAGAGCGRFGALQAALGGAATVVGAALPGREQRWAEPVPGTVEEVVAAVADALEPLPGPLVVLGQSLGGLLGYEIARERARRTGRWPAALVVAACRPPALWAGAGRGIAADPAALAELVDGQGLDADDLDEDTRELVLELLAADAAMTAGYAPADTGPVGCPLEVWGGVADPTVTAEHLDGWGPVAGAGLRVRRFPGGHYFPDQHPALVVEALRGLLADVRDHHEGARP